jgi:hypothetical protein
MLVVEIAVHVPQRVMKGAMLAPAVEAFLVCAPVYVRRLIMESIVTVMVVLVIVIISRRSRGQWQREPQHAGEYRGLVHCLLLRTQPDFIRQMKG